MYGIFPVVIAIVVFPVGVMFVVLTCARLLGQG